MRGLKKKKKQDELIESYPEFYEKLKNLKISILPIAGKKNGYISKKIQIFNNSVGYASREQGGNLIVKEQWLENPEWEICVFVDSPEAEKIKEAICGKRCVYYPYLGKNDHLADIKSVSVEEASEISFSAGRLDCLVPEDFAESSGLDFDEKKDLDISCEFKYQEALPYAIDGYLNLYILKTFIYTDDYIKMKDGVKVFQLKLYHTYYVLKQLIYS